MKYPHYVSVVREQLLFVKDHRLSVWLVLLLLGCARSPAVNEAPEGDPPSLQAPIELAVEHAVVVGPSLHLRARVVAKTSVAVEGVELTARGLSNAQTVAARTRTLGEVMEESHLAEGQQVFVDFVLPAKDITEYQIVAAWGGEKTQVTQPVRVRLEELSVTVDQAADGREYPVVSGTLAWNPADEPEEILLAVGIRREGEPHPNGGLVAGEELLTLKKEVLQGRVSRPVRVRLRKPLPAIESGPAYVPYLRIVSYSVTD